MKRKLTRDEVIDIRTSCLRQEDLAVKYGMSQPAINQIIKGVTYKHVEVLPTCQDDHRIKWCTCDLCNQSFRRQYKIDGETKYLDHNRKYCLDCFPPGTRRPKALIPLVDRFWEKVDIREPDECWNWLGGDRGKGYGAIKDGYKTYGAHRVSWIINNGIIPDGLLVCHHCDNKRCVNPYHLFLGTYKDNLEDAYSKGRITNPKGENVKSSKLTEQQVREIRASSLSERILGKNIQRRPYLYWKY